MLLEPYRPPPLPSGRFTIQLAKSMSDRYDALQFRHEVYLEKGLDSSQTPAPITKYHVENEWFIATAKLESEIIGTVSFFVGSHLMMPASELLDLSFYGSKQLCEFSGMAVHRQYQRSHSVFLPLAKFCLDFASDYLRVAAAVAAVHPKQVPFYCNVLNFQLVSEKTFKYETVNNALAQVIAIDTYNYRKTVQQRMLKDENYRMIGGYLIAADQAIWKFPQLTN